MSGRVVIDASVALAWLLPDEGELRHRDVLAGAPHNPPLVPPLWFFEVANGLHAAVRRRRLGAREAAQALDLVAALPVQAAPMGWPEVREAARLAAEFELSVYDAAYLALARLYDAQLLTLDAVLGRAAARARPG